VIALYDNGRRGENMRNIAKFIVIIGIVCSFCGCGKLDEDGSVQHKSENAVPEQRKLKLSPAGMKFAKTIALAEMDE